jgi:hypothetical protein
MRRYLLAALIASATVFTASRIGDAFSQTPGCVTVRPGVFVDLNNETNAQTIAHERAAVANGQPRILHIDRGDADAHRALSLKGVPVRSGFDRDEYPPAMSAEGGTGADVAYISPADNRSSGSRMRAQLAAYCDGTAFILEP